MLANYIIKHLLSMHDLNIVAIVESDAVYPGKGKWQSLIFMIRKSGLQYVGSQIIKFLYFHIGSTLYGFFPGNKPSHILYSYHEITKTKHIPILLEKNINTQTFITTMQSLKPDLFVSIFFNQIFKKNVLSLPKRGTINLHPAYLPSYRGLSPTFWVLANGEHHTGITVHRIDSEAIDAGQILGQIRIPILAQDTEYSLYWRCVRMGVPLLEDIITSIDRNKRNHAKPDSRVKPSYFSLPKKSDVNRFCARGRKFLTLRQLVGSPKF